MSQLATENISSTMPYYIKKVRCPINFVLKPGHEPFLMEPIPYMMNIKDADAKKFGLKKFRAKKDRFGNKIVNFKSYYQPLISAAMAISNIYNPKNGHCGTRCRRCLEGSNGASIAALKMANGG